MRELEIVLWIDVCHVLRNFYPYAHWIILLSLPYLSYHFQPYPTLPYLTLPNPIQPNLSLPPFLFQAKASMIWIIGEYAERIDNADELLESFLGASY